VRDACACGAGQLSALPLLPRVPAVAGGTRGDRLAGLATPTDVLPPSLTASTGGVTSEREQLGTCRAPEALSEHAIRITQR
jgi:hypothetical protein